MKKKELIIKNKLGLHARAAAKIVSVTNKFDSNITITSGEIIADAKSIMKILMLAAPKGTEIEISASGKDEDRALKTLETLIVDKFNEEWCGYNY